MYIEINNLSKSISKHTVLDNINICMERGKIYGLKGKNGSGKTMLMRAICGLILPTTGEIIIDGEKLGENLSFPKSIGALIESPGFIPEYSGFKNLNTIASILNIIQKDEIERLMKEFDLDPTDKKKFKNFSLGMKQKLGIIAAIMENPEIIVLDEPINALDEKSVSVVKNQLSIHKQKGALILISCHDKEELEFLSDEIFCMENGKIIDQYIVSREDAIS